MEKTTSSEENTSEVREEPVTVDFGRAKTVRRCSAGLVYNFCLPIYFVDALFCWCLFFVGAYILSTPVFCWQQYLVNAYILSTPIFCQRQYFVDPIFCWWQYFFNANIFCQCQYFVKASILSMPIFCPCQYFVDAYIFTDANILSAPRSVPIFIEFIANYYVVYISWLLICLNLLKIPVDHCFDHNKGFIWPHSYCVRPALCVEK